METLVVTGFCPLGGDGGSESIDDNNECDEEIETEEVSSEGDETEAENISEDENKKEVSEKEE